ncbi:MAG: hypothetical protein KF914_20795 [Rhizobiaceae bacterium]|nr:hypothetical protein [Rhizobiaceae bacterium]
MSAPVRIALVQGSGQPLSVAASMSQLAADARRAAEGGARLLLTSELAISGYGDAETTRRMAVNSQQATSEIGAIARQSGLAIAAGYSERTATGFSNAALLVSAEGQRLLNYRKMHLWGEYEEQAFEPGAPGDLAEIEGLKAGLLICFDLDHPVTAQDLAARGADLILVLSATSVPYDIVPIAQAPVRAYENAVFLAFCNQAGSQNGFDFVGLSGICAPDGSVLARAGRGPGEMIFADIDQDAFAGYRRAHRYAGKLRDDLYPRPERLG